MKKEHTYHIYIYSNVGGLHTLQKDFEFTGSKTGAIKIAKEEKKHMKDYGICQLPMHYSIYDFDIEEYL